MGEGKCFLILWLANGEKITVIKLLFGNYSLSKYSQLSFRKPDEDKHQISGSQMGRIARATCLADKSARELIHNSQERCFCGDLRNMSLYFHN